MYMAFYIAHSGCGFPLGNQTKIKNDQDSLKIKSPKGRTTIEEDEEEISIVFTNSSAGYITIPVEAALNAKEDTDDQYGHRKQ